MFYLFLLPATLRQEAGMMFFRCCNFSTIPPFFQEEQFDPMFSSINQLVCQFIYQVYHQPTNFVFNLFYVCVETFQPILLTGLKSQQRRKSHWPTLKTQLARFCVIFMEILIYHYHHINWQCLMNIILG